jgi:predicted negative regulator of RcsB-dependent stress response|tara:strand:+ start:1282 stop:1431 length:150 start_codon:yes stop_codon:yes gene_type:complete
MIHAAESRLKLAIEHEEKGEHDKALEQLNNALEAEDLIFARSHPPEKEE